ncbi:glycosyltransferase [Agromyces sp. Marseille-Q5079]|uniref:glycosyltransferase n=1 Tax=Agromyces sp. Marseille-Q5079 TaxID=3439059 RepID=UPI003D9C8B5B
MIRVLHTLAAPDGTTRYVDHMIGSAAPDVQILTFSWGRALFGRYDLLHVHWPEYLVRHRTHVGAFAKAIALRLLLARLVLLHTPIVRTVHNVMPHEHGSARERNLLEALDRRTSLWIRLNPTTELPVGVRSVNIPHGHYRSVYPGADHEPVAGRILQFGLLRPYKGVEALIRAFRELDDSSTSLRIVGKPYSPSYERLICALSSGTPAISTKLEFVPDAELAEEIRQAELVVLPYVEMHNSGAILVALSLGRPVLAPRTHANVVLAEEVGDGWISFFTDSLEPGALELALLAARSSERSAAPDLSARDWSIVGQRHRDAYLQVLEQRHA